MNPDKPRPYATRLKANRRTARALRLLTRAPMGEYLPARQVFGKVSLYTPPRRSAAARLLAAGWLDVQERPAPVKVRLRPEVTGYADAALERYEHRNAWFWDSVLVGAIAGLFD